MRRFDYYFLYFLTLSILALVFLGVPKVQRNKQTQSTSFTDQQKVSHMVKFMGAKGSDLCTATAIGPHAFLTAKHCNASGIKTVRLDMSMEDHNVVGWTDDKRDHLIVLIEGTPFTDYETVKLAQRVYLGDTVTFYGIDEGYYPARAHYGKVVDCHDPSDVDASAGQLCFHIEVYPGDSGSAVYNVRGEIVGLLSLRIEDEESIGFAMDFPPALYDFVATFQPSAPPSQ